MKKYNQNKCYVVVNWTGDFQYPNEKETRKQTEVFTFDKVPTEQEIKTELEQYQSNVMSRSDWTNVRIVGYSILPPMTIKDIILK
jgi:hypothetical protein